MSDFKFIVEQTPLGPHTHVFIDGVEIPGVKSCEGDAVGLNEPGLVMLTFYADSINVVYLSDRHG